MQCLNSLMVFASLKLKPNYRSFSARDSSAIPIFARFERSACNALSMVALISLTFSKATEVLSTKTIASTGDPENLETKHTSPALLMPITTSASAACSSFRVASIMTRFPSSNVWKVTDSGLCVMFNATGTRSSSP